MAYIYLITNEINQKGYVGKTTGSIQDRFKRHVIDSKKEKNKDIPLYRAFQKYGISNFHIKMLEECSSADSSAREIYWIGKLDTYKKGYNATLGGDGCLIHDYKSIVKKYLECQNEKETAQFFHCDTKTVRLALKEYQIKPTSAGRMGKERNGKKIAMLDIHTSATIKVFNDMCDAGRFLQNTKNVQAQIRSISALIGKVASNKRNSAYGYKWKFI